MDFLLSRVHSREPPMVVTEEISHCECLFLKLFRISDQIHVPATMVEENLYRQLLFHFRRFCKPRPCKSSSGIDSRSPVACICPKSSALIFFIDDRILVSTASPTPCIRRIPAGEVSIEESGFFRRKLAC